MKWTVYIVMVVVTFLYLIIGAVVFHVLEHESERQAKFAFAKVHELFLKNNTCITRSILEDYVMKVIETQSKGVAVNRIVDLFRNKNSTSLNLDVDDNIDTKWDFASAMLFCVTVISTIGYGNMSPKTSNGQLFCIFYSLIGIPMFATVLVGTGERLQIPIKKVHNWRPWIKDNQSRDEQVKSTVLLTTGTFIIVFIPSVTFVFSEKWTYLESMYYTVITLTTIGFGDLVPGYFEKPADGKMRQKNVLFRVVLGLWILFGLSWGALILSEIGSLLQKKIVTATSQTQYRLSTLEGIVKKKAKEARARISNKEKCEMKNSQDLPEVEICTGDNGSEKSSEDEELKYEPTDSDY